MIIEDKSILVKQALHKFMEFCMNLPPKKFLSVPKFSTEKGDLVHELKYSPIVYMGSKNYRIVMEMRYYVEEITEPGEID